VQPRHLRRIGLATRAQERHTTLATRRDRRRRAHLGRRCEALADARHAERIDQLTVAQHVGTSLRLHDETVLL